MLINAGRSALLIVDVQERLMPAVAEADAVVRNCARLMRAAARLDVPILVSEQYPKGLGATLGELADLAPPEAVVSKMHFSCSADTEYARRFAALGRDQAIIAGIETHVCVLQTALGFRRAGHECFVVADAAASRSPDDKAWALARLGGDGVAIVTTEMVLFEWLEKAGTPEFKELSRLVK
jgi:nicotinamidase-related amidase